MTDAPIKPPVVEGRWEHISLIRWFTYVVVAHGVLILFAGAVLFFRGEL